MRHTLNFLKEKEFISADSYDQLMAHEESKPMSLFWHVRTMLYLGVSILASSLGIIIYNNIDTIGHLTLIILIAIACLGCFYYGIKKVPDFSPNKSESPNTWLDYIILLGVLLFLTLEGYLQYQYNIFGERYGLATIIPALILLLIAYRFDHIGILSMSITLFASWLGLTLTPLELMSANDFSSEPIVHAGIILCAVLLGAGFISRLKDFKAHFEFTYNNFGIHLGAIAILTAAFDYDYGLLWLLLIVPLLYFTYKYAISTSSFYFLLCAYAYAYISVSYVLLKIVIKLDSDYLIWSYLVSAYFIVTGIYSIKFLKESHKKMKADDRV